MEQGYIKIKENKAGQLIIEAEIVNGTLWMTKHEIADLFNVVVNSVGATILKIFKSGILREENVTRVHKFKLNGRSCEVVLYNLEAIIHIGFTVASFEAKAFRECALKGFSEYLKGDKEKSSNVLIVLNDNLKIPMITSLN